MKLIDPRGARPSDDAIDCFDSKIEVGDLGPAVDPSDHFFVQFNLRRGLRKATIRAALGSSGTDNRVNRTRDRLPVDTLRRSPTPPASEKEVSDLVLFSNLDQPPTLRGREVTLVVVVGAVGTGAVEFRRGFHSGFLDVEVVERGVGLGGDMAVPSLYGVATGPFGPRAAGGLVKTSEVVALFSSDAVLVPTCGNLNVGSLTKVNVALRGLG